MPIVKFCLPPLANKERVTAVTFMVSNEESVSRHLRERRDRHFREIQRRRNVRQRVPVKYKFLPKKLHQPRPLWLLALLASRQTKKRERLGTRTRKIKPSVEKFTCPFCPDTFDYFIWRNYHIQNRHAVKRPFKNSRARLVPVIRENPYHKIDLRRVHEF